ncbi:MAG: DNA cytosine methyltransferase [Burkholderiaceae bacterium]|nr:DNA cytosine methyltransferase [Burkholderiaceae bacterium]
MTKRSPIRTLCIYSGCGGLDLGFANAGYSIQTAIDHNKFAVSAHQRNMPGVAVEGDLTQPIDFGSTEYDVVIGGPPCQGFSLAGKRRLDDPRNSHIARFVEIAISVRPKLIVMENVPGLLYGDLAKHHEKANATLRANGFRTKTIKIDTSEFGVPQHRTRVVLVGWTASRSDIDLVGNAAKANVRQALSGLTSTTPDHAKRLLPTTSKDFLIANKIGPGMKLSNVRAGVRNVHTWQIPEVFGEITQKEHSVLDAMLRLRRLERRRDFGDADPVSVSTLSEYIGFSTQITIKNLLTKNYVRRIDKKYVDLTHTFNGKYRRLNWDNISYTVDTYFGNPKYFLHPTEHRGLTVREAARLQTFPDSFEFTGPEVEKYKMIGNAVPPQFARTIAEQLRTLLLD